MRFRIVRVSGIEESYHVMRDHAEAIHDLSHIRCAPRLHPGLEDGVLHRSQPFRLFVVSLSS